MDINNQLVASDIDAVLRQLKGLVEDQTLKERLLYAVREYGLREGEDDLLKAEVVLTLLEVVRMIWSESHATRTEIHQWASDELGTEIGTES